MHFYNNVKYTSYRFIPSASVERINYFNLLSLVKQIKLNQLHAVSRTQQGRQRELCVKTLRSPLSAEFWRHYALSETNS